MLYKTRTFGFNLVFYTSQWSTVLHSAPQFVVSTHITTSTLVYYPLKETYTMHKWAADIFSELVCFYPEYKYERGFIQISLKSWLRQNWDLQLFFVQSHFQVLTYLVLLILGYCSLFSISFSCSGTRFLFVSQSVQAYVLFQSVAFSLNIDWSEILSLAPKSDVVYKFVSFSFVRTSHLQEQKKSQFILNKHEIDLLRNTNMIF